MDDTVEVKFTLDAKMAERWREQAETAGIPFDEWIKEACKQKYLTELH